MFELHITCSKDIDKLKIDFSDGTSVVTEKKQSKPSKPREPREPREEKQSSDFDDFEAYTPKKESIKPIELPEIVDRPVKIDNILNNFEI